MFIYTVSLKNKFCDLVLLILFFLGDSLHFTVFAVKVIKKLKSFFITTFIEVKCNTWLVEHIAISAVIRF